MNETLALALMALAGALLGAFFFGGLWWTVRQCVNVRHPALWLFASLLLRMSVALTAFYLLGRGHWQRLLMCVLGFLVARLIVTWLTRPTVAGGAAPAAEARHAP